MAQRAPAVASTGMVWLHSVAPHQKHNLPLSDCNAGPDCDDAQQPDVPKVASTGRVWMHMLKITIITLSEFNEGLGDDVPHRDVPTAAAVTGRLRVPTHSSRCLRSQLHSR